LEEIHRRVRVGEIDSFLLIFDGPDFEGRYNTPLVKDEQKYRFIGLMEKIKEEILKTIE
jgi:hypothetical protein